MILPPPVPQANIAVLNTQLSDASLNPPQGGAMGKPEVVKETTQTRAQESVQEGGKTEALDIVPKAAQETPTHAVEVEKSAEIPPELEAWVEEVTQHEEELPQEIVIADKTTQQSIGQGNEEPLIVLPLTQLGMQAGLLKPVSDSVRWLTVWCKRIVEKFHGRVVYRPPSSQKS